MKCKMSSIINKAFKREVLENDIFKHSLQAKKKASFHSPNNLGIKLAI